MNFIKKLLKTLLALLTVLIVAGIGYYFYEKHEEEKGDEYELSYDSKVKWSWHNKYERIQIYTSKSKNKSYLRRVNLNGGYIIYARKNDDYSLSAMAAFLIPCEPGKKIDTSVKYSDGTPKRLKCNKAGSALYYNAKWPGRDTDFTWKENLDGFSLSEDFTYWDFTKLDQEITLSKGK